MHRVVTHTHTTHTHFTLLLTLTRLQLLGWERNVRVFNSLYWVGHVAIGALFALVTLRSLGGGKKERRGGAYTHTKTQTHTPHTHTHASLDLILTLRCRRRVQVPCRCRRRRRQEGGVTRHRNSTFSDPTISHPLSIIASYGLVKTQFPFFIPSSLANVPGSELVAHPI